MRTFQKTIAINAPPETIFAFMDDIHNSGMHMTGRSMAMFGSRLNLEVLSTASTGPDVSYRWKGRIVGLPVDFTVVVKKWIKDVEKVWETIGHPKVIVIGWFRMFLNLTPVDGKTSVTLGITYDRPKGLLGKLLCLLLGPWYAKWCLKKMLRDANKQITSHDTQERQHIREQQPA